MPQIDVINSRARPWRAVIIRDGDKYGLDNCLTVDDGPLVEFYDMANTKMHGDAGQFVARYYVETLVSAENFRVGLCLQGYAPEWEIDADTMLIIRLWLENQESNK
jgi:hypothetical protein